MPPPDENAVPEPPISLAIDAIADPSDETLGRSPGVVSTNPTIPLGTEDKAKSGVATVDTWT